jgi:Reverse transcriptase (RNA-dependent DNA polymerase)
VYGVDYDETYSPVTRLTSLRVICTIAAQNDWPSHQMDVDSAYLNAELPDPIYMKQQHGYEKGDERHVLLLKRPLYCLKQSGREWHKHSSNELFKLRFIKSRSDAAVFYRRGSKGHAIVATAVDDLTITAESQAIIDGIKRNLNKVFKMKDLGEIHWLLNLKIECDWNAKTIAISQAAYIDRIIDRFNLQDAKSCVTPLDPNLKLSEDKCPETERGKEAMAKTPYRQVISSLMWAAVATQPDIAFAVSTLSQLLENPGGTHWNTAKHVLKYLKGMRDYKLTLGGNREGLVGYMNSLAMSFHF